MIRFRRIKRWTRRVLFLTLLTGGVSYFIGGSSHFTRDWDGWKEYIAETYYDVREGDFTKITESFTQAPDRLRETGYYLQERFQGDGRTFTGDDSSSEEEVFAIRRFLEKGYSPLYGTPIVTDPELKMKILDNGPWMVGYAAEEGYPAWVGYVAIKTDKRKSDPRPSGFTRDLRTRTRWGDHIPQSDDYTHTGFDRGHLYPNYLASVVFGPKVQEDTFLVTNILPMTPELNRGIWQELEELVGTKYRNDYGELFIFTGPIFTTPPSQARFLDPQTREHQIPDAFYKMIFYNHVWGQRKVLSFIIPQNPTSRDLNRYIVSVDEIEELTGLDFFHALDDRIEDMLESARPARIW